MSLFEKPSGFPAFADIPPAVNRHNLANGFVGFLFATSGPLAIMFAVTTAAGLGREEIMSWMLGGYGVGGVLSIVFCLLYRQPISIAWSIPGAVMVGPALMTLSFNEVVGAYMVTAGLILFLGLTGLIRRVMDLIPMPIVMGMVAGVFLAIGLKLVNAFGDAFWLAFAMVAAFAAVSAVPRLARVFPPVLAALIVGLVLVGAGGHLSNMAAVDFAIATPAVYRPEFSFRAIAELVIPLTISVVAIHNPQAFVILKNAGYKPPQNALTVICGEGSALMGVLGCVPAVVTGPVNAILNSSGPKEHRYMGGVVFGVCILLFGLFAPVTAAYGLALPVAFVGVIGGLALLGVLRDSFQQAFSGRFTMGALVTFMVTVSGISIFNIGAPFWGLVFGVITSLLVERGDFQALRQTAR